MNESEPNENMENKCPQCGAPLPSGVLAGLCPACLFKQGAAADTAVPPESAAFQPPGVEEVARLFPQLEIIAFIGKGGMGAVYKARQRALDRIVALKILPPQTAGDPGFIERFNREARALARLNHPNIVAVYEFGQVNGLPFFIMEFVDGLNLRELERAGKLSPREALQIVPQICEALQFAHDEGIVHRDIKPENILLDKKGRVKIADFGIAKILGAVGDVDLTKTKGVIGTPHYMAPEQMEKPTAVDHRADIFSLGVVFYEMLTGELPLGKFGPPSSRKVEVDVRLDDVVLRALERDPARRYQHASQVKTAVDTIAGTTAPPPRNETDETVAREVLARDYTLKIGSCVRRGWALLKGHFWSFVGITVLLMALLGFASSFGGASVTRGAAGGTSVKVSSGIAMLLWGPLWGGLLFYYLKKIRKEPATVETAFCGFSSRFLQLFLAGFVTSLLTWLGFLCLVLPGIFLAVSWIFTLPLVVDKQLDFWSAMELSRKMVAKHWFKLFGFVLVLMLLTFAGVLALGFGVLVAIPLVMAALMYAYEDIFGGMQGAAAPPPGFGPSGTVVTPAAPRGRQPSAGAGWTLATKIGLAAVALIIGAFVLIPLLRLPIGFVRKPSSAVPLLPPAATASGPVQVDTLAEAASTVAEIPSALFDSVTERELTNLESINLVSGRTGSLPQFVTERSGTERDSAACAWMEGAGMDLAYAGGGEFYSMTHDMAALKREQWDDATADSVAESLRETNQSVSSKFGGPDSPNDVTNHTYAFRTRDGFPGVLQVTGFSENPERANIRYKFFQPAATLDSVGSPVAAKDVRATLSARFEAASSISDVTAKNKPLAALAADAAKAGEVEIARKAITQISDMNERDAANREACLLLAKRGLRTEAVSMAKGISDFGMRNQTLSELAR